MVPLFDRRRYPPLVDKSETEDGCNPARFVKPFEGALLNETRLLWPSPRDAVLIPNHVAAPHFAMRFRALGEAWHGLSSKAT